MWPLISVLFWDFALRRLVVFTDVSGKRIGPIFNGQAVQEGAILLLFLMFLLYSVPVALKKFKWASFLRIHNLSCLYFG